MNNFQNQKQQSGSGLTRYRSAPSSYFTNILNNNSGGFGTEDYEQLFNSEPVFAQPFLAPQVNSEPVINNQSLQRQQTNDYSSVVYQDVNTGTQNNSYGSVLGSNLVAQVKMESGSSSGLIRQSSSPAGFFANINIEKEFGGMRGMGEFGGGNTSKVEGSFSTKTRFNNSHQIDFSSSRRASTSSGMMMAPISETGNVHVKENNSGDLEFDEGNSLSGFPMNTWDDPAMFSDNYLNELADNESKGFVKTNTSNDQANEGGSHSRSRLASHLSMPTSSAELSAMEKMLQDSVPCKLRAKRGFATHPRSIAERVRRTKISDRMRKLQDLVPNMEKQTNTSDMLDLAVDYIKDLQKQVTNLSDTKDKCTCSGKH